MLGKRSEQRGLFEADHLYLDFVGRDSFYGFLATQRGKLFRDEEFAGCGESQAWLGFNFDPAISAACSMRPNCVKAGLDEGRTVSLHPQEGLLREARAFQHSGGFSSYRQLRQAAEHRLARLMQLEVRQARYFGRVKTLFQLLMAATMANLTLVATKVGLMRGRGSKSAHLFARSTARLVAFIAAFIVSVSNIFGRNPFPPAQRRVVA